MKNNYHNKTAGSQKSEVRSQNRLGIILYSVFCILYSSSSFSQSREVPFTLDDRDRIIQMQITMNERFESINTSMNIRFESMNTSMNTRFESINTRFESQQQQLNDMKALFYWGFGIMIALMGGLFGYIVWDRRTVTEPIKERIQSLIQTLREYAKEQPKLADLLRSHGLM